MKRPTLNGLPITAPDGADIDQAAEHIAAALGYLLPEALDLEGDSMRDTPHRLARALAEMTAGYYQDPADLVRAFDAEGYDQVIGVKDIAFASLCEHHVLPFTGTVAIAYLPGAKILGLSKLPRIVGALARRLQVQERMTQQIAEAVRDTVNARGVAVIVRGRHSCMALRGVRAHGEMVTSVMLGAFRDSVEARAEVLELLR